MERKRAWITAATVSVCLATGSLAVMANTGLLTSKPSTDPIGTLAPGDITIEATENLLDAETSVETSVEAPTSVVIRYEDVYVIDDPLVTVPTPEPTEVGSSEVEVPASLSVPISPDPSPRNGSAAKKATQDTDDEDEWNGDHEEGEEEEDDDDD